MYGPKCENLNSRKCHDVSKACVTLDQFVYVQAKQIDSEHVLTNHLCMALYRYFASFQTAFPTPVAIYHHQLAMLRMLHSSNWAWPGTILCEHVQAQRFVNTCHTNLNCKIYFVAQMTENLHQQKIPIIRYHVPSSSSGQKYTQHYSSWSTFPGKRLALCMIMHSINAVKMAIKTKIKINLLTYFEYIEVVQLALSMFLTT